MNKIFRSLVLAGIVSIGVLPFAGCSGGSSSNLSIGRFAGSYSGTFNGLLAPGLPNGGTPVSGTFVASVDSSGNVTGSVTQPGIGTFAATGSVNNRGTINVVATIPDGSVSTLSGSIERLGGNFVTSGILTTVNGGVTIVNGTFSGSRDVEVR